MFFFAEWNYANIEHATDAIKMRFWAIPSDYETKSTAVRI